jgi:putative MFS transporter
MTTLAEPTIAARLDRLPPNRQIRWLVTLISFGGWFEFYDLFFTAYIAVGLFRGGLFKPTTQGLFDLDGFASFIAALFTGLFIGTIAFSWLSDRFGRRSIFTFALIWYSLGSLVMALQTSAAAIDLWRLIASIGIGVELVNIDTYISELVPKEQRGPAFAYNQFVMFTVVPVVALLAWLLVPHGRAAEADRIVRELEARVVAETGQPLPAPQMLEGEADTQIGPKPNVWREMWSPAYRGRTLMLVVYNLFQTIGYYGFASWVPTFLISQGIEVTRSLQYTFIIALANPVGPLLGVWFADKIERKWQIAWAALVIAVLGLLFSQQRSAAGVIGFGLLITLANNWLSFSFHAYQSELYPTRIRASAVGFVYSWSRFSTIFSGYIIAFFLGRTGTTGVFGFIAAAMVVVFIVIGAFGPATTRRRLEEIAG